MDSDSWVRLSTSSRRYQSRSDLYHGGEEFDGDDESRPEFLCPFCAEDFDVSLMVMMSRGRSFCARSVLRISMLLGFAVILMKSMRSKRRVGDYVQRKRRFRRGGFNSTFSISRKELREANLQSLLRDSSFLISSSNSEPDPLLSSFIHSRPVVNEPTGVQPHSSAGSCAVEASSVEDSSKRNIQQSPLSDKDLEEKARKCEFVQGLLLSTFLHDD
ncbi:unnamed protein product [Ilex paraguariensis]|uniref:Di19 C-terminal domain-containing protein n=1 Tax=Ilex paraguariensis TaxID=185542 RepID=A0ABC8V3N4_9AQUA